MKQFMVLFLVVALWFRTLCKAAFYQGYFEQHQRNRGKDPQAELKKDFHGLERILFYFVLWKP